MVEEREGERNQTLEQRRENTLTQDPPDLNVAEDTQTEPRLRQPLENSDAIRKPLLRGWKFLLNQATHRVFCQAWFFLPNQSGGMRPTSVQLDAALSSWGGSADKERAHTAMCSVISASGH